jgi:hypothetical protein
VGVGVEACAAGADGSGFVDAVTVVGDRGAEALPEELALGTTDGETDGQDDAAVVVGEADCSHAGPPAMESVVRRSRVISATALAMRHADAATATRIRLRMAQPTVPVGVSAEKPVGVPA